MERGIKLQLGQYKQAFSIIDQCTDDYMFVYDIVKDSFRISRSALDVFSLESVEFSQATEILKGVIYKDDYQMVSADIERIRECQQRSQDLEYRWIDKKGHPIWMSSRGCVITDKDEIPHYLVGRIAQLDKQNKYDKVTGIYCENVLEQEYANLMECNYCHLNRGYLLVIGIDNFREINEKYGRQIGDTVLLDVSRCISQCVSDSKFIFRLKGDEFAVLVPSNATSPMDEAKELYKHIRSSVDTSIEQSGYHIFYTVSGGGCTFDATKDHFDLIMRNVRFALHSAKLNGKNVFAAYTLEDYQSYIKRLDLQEHLRKSIEHDFDGFEVYYQPIMKMSRNRVCGAEALIRWNSVKYGFMSPVEFVPLLEESSLIIPLGKWVIEQAVRQCKLWMETIPDFVMNINLSFVQILKSDILKDALECIDSYGITHEHVVFEITESGKIESNQAVRNVLNSFNEKCFNLAIDDFGTGYSNLRYIKDMMFGIIKIDRLFVKNIHKSNDNYMLVKYMTELAHNLNLKVCVEGVETEEELEKVMTLDPDCIQGYYYGKPMKEDSFTDTFLESAAKLKKI